MNRSLKKLSEFTFEDEIAKSFFYDSKGKTIEIGFEGYYKYGLYHNTPCKLIISNWTHAQSRIYESQHFQSLEANLGIVSLILSLEIEVETITLSANTVDNRYVEWYFEQSNFEVITNLQEMNPRANQ
jgi:hypothetical protein